MLCILFYLLHVDRLSYTKDNTVNDLLPELFLVTIFLMGLLMLSEFHMGIDVYQLQRVLLTASIAPLVLVLNDDPLNQYFII